MLNLAWPIYIRNRNLYPGQLSTSLLGVLTFFFSLLLLFPSAFDYFFDSLHQLHQFVFRLMHVKQRTSSKQQIRANREVSVRLGSSRNHGKGGTGRVSIHYHSQDSTLFVRTQMSSWHSPSLKIDKEWGRMVINKRNDIEKKSHGSLRRATRPRCLGTQLRI